MADSNRKESGQFFISDPEICGGQLTFKDIRIFVKDVLEMVADETPWEQISEAWFGRVSHEAIAEAVELSRQSFGKGKADFLERLLANPLKLDNFELLTSAQVYKGA